MLCTLFWVLVQFVCWMVGEIRNTQHRGGKFVALEESKLRRRLWVTADAGSPALAGPT